MKTILSSLLAGALFFLPLLSSAQNLTDEQAAMVIARVGDEEITAGEFARDLQFRLGRIKAATGKDVKADIRIRRALMNELIQERILSIASRNAGTTVPDEEVDAEFETRKEVFDSEDGYTRYLEALKLTEEELRGHVRSRMRIKKFIDEETGPLSASEEEVAKLYGELKDQGKFTRTKDTRDIRVILVRAKGGSDEDWRAAEEKAEEITKRLAGGEDFAEVAKAVSEDPSTAPNGGLLIEMELGSFYPELEEAMAELAAGEVSKPVRSVMGWYIITIQQVNTPGIVPLEKVADRLESEVIDTKRKVAVDAIVEEAQKLIRVEMVKFENAPPQILESQ